MPVPTKGRQVPFFRWGTLLSDMMEIQVGTSVPFIASPAWYRAWDNPRNTVSLTSSSSVHQHLFLFFFWKKQWLSYSGIFVDFFNVHDRRRFCSFGLQENETPLMSVLAAKIKKNKYVKLMKLTWTRAKSSLAKFPEVSPATSLSSSFLNTKERQSKNQI